MSKTRILAQKLFSTFGYKMVASSRLKPFIPFVRHCSIHNVEFDFWITNRDASGWYCDENYSHGANAAEVEALSRLASPGDHVLEIGAHHGFTALLLNSFVGSSGSVTSFEAHPGNMLVAHANKSLNANQNIKFLHGAASDTPGELHIAACHNSQVVSGGSDTIVVPSITIDEIVDNFGPFNMVKIDVEGYELSVLKGAIRFLRTKPKIAIEIHFDGLSELGQSVEELFDSIQLDGYKGVFCSRDLEDSKTLHEFDRKTVPQNGIINLFLEYTAST